MTLAGNNENSIASTPCLGSLPKDVDFSIITHVLGGGPFEKHVQIEIFKSLAGFIVKTNRFAS